MKFGSYLKQVGRNVKSARQKCGLTQLDVHEWSGLTYRHYQNIEAGRVNITLETIYRLSKVFKIPVEDLLKET